MKQVLYILILFLVAQNFDTRNFFAHKNRKHINNIFKNEELNKDEVCAKSAHTTEHGAIQGKTQTRELDYYNLDMII